MSINKHRINFTSSDKRLGVVKSDLMVKIDKTKIRGIFLVLLANLIWGTSAFLVKFFPVLDAASIVWARSVFGALMMFAWLWFFIKPFSNAIKIKRQLKE